MHQKHLTLLGALLACVTLTQAVVVKPYEYGPPRPSPQYGPPHIPHREYGVPQQIPFREYGPPSIKYGPPKLNFIGGGGNVGAASNSFSSGFHEQVKTHFGVPKPFYGPPHIATPHKPAPSYGPPPPRPPPQSYGPPPPRPPPPNYGPPPPRPPPSYGPPPQIQPHHPATSYGPPPSGPLNIPPKQSYGPPPPSNYGPPPLPIQLPGPKPAAFHNRPHETTIIVSGGSGGGGGSGHHGFSGGPIGGGSHGFGGSGIGGGGPIKQVQIQIDSSGHTHSVSGSQAPFHTACDGWKPIPAPVGAYVASGNVNTQSGYSQVSHGNFGTQYSSGSIGTTGTGSSGIVDGLTDEQLVAVALQSGSFDDSNTLQLHTQNLPAPSGPALNIGVQPTGGDGGSHGLNSIETEALQLSLSSIDDTYSKPPPDSYAPGSIHAQKFNGPPPPPPSGNYGPPPPRPANSYGPPPSGNAFAHQQQHHHHHHHHHVSGGSNGLALQYGTQSGNLHNFGSHGGPPPPQKPVAYRPPVPQGLLESIGATVQHVDQFGVKPKLQPPTYIPPAANSIAEVVTGNAAEEYGPPPLPELPPAAPVPPTIVEQQLPQHGPAHFVQVNQHRQQQQQFQNQQQQHYHHHQQQQQYQQLLPLPQTTPQFIHLPPLQGGPPPPPPQPLYVPPPPPQHSAPGGQYLPPIGGNGGSGLNAQFTSTGFEHAYSASQLDHQYIQSQGLPVPQVQEPRFNAPQPHDCGQGPNLVGAGYQFQSTQGQSASSAISPSISVAESHSQFVAGPGSSYGPPASGNDIDHIGYASQKSAVATLPDNTDPQSLPGLEGLDGLNVISAQKSQSIHLNSEQSDSAATAQPKFQLDFGANAVNLPNDEQSADHEEILSQGLLESILTAIEQPQNKNGGQQSQTQNIENAQSRSDTNVHESSIQAESGSATTDHDHNVDHDHDETELATSGSSKIQVIAVAPHGNHDDEEIAASVQEIKAIVPEDVDGPALDDEAKH